MGKTSFMGPVYGAKSLLWSFFSPSANNSSNGNTTAAYAVNGVANMTVRPYEDWYVTEASIVVSTHSSVANNISVKLKVEGGSTTALGPRPYAVPGNSGTTNNATILTMTQTGTSTSWSTWATATAEASEYEGTWCPAGSSLRFVSSGTSLPGNTMFNVWGFVRYIDSTRAS